MIDRPARELLVTAIDSFLNEEIDASAFNHAIFEEPCDVSEERRVRPTERRCGDKSAGRERGRRENA